MSTINAEAFAMIAKFASTDTSRRILAGVWCRADGVLVATNGHALGMYKDGHNGPEAIVPASKDVVAFMRKQKRTEVDYSVKDDTVTLTTANGAQSITVRAIEGPYPHVEQTFPRDFQSIEAIGLNPKLFALFGEHAMAFFSGAERAALVYTKDPSFVGLIMPMRSVGDHAVACLPAWVNYVQPVTEAVSELVDSAA